jgi:hypothetical protein
LAEALVEALLDVPLGEALVAERVRHRGGLGGEQPPGAEREPERDEQEEGSGRTAVPQSRHRRTVGGSKWGPGDFG